MHRVGKGLGLNSHAATCAKIFGIPGHIVRRAQYVRYAARPPFTPLRKTVSCSHLLSIHELGVLLDEEMTDEEKADLEDAEEVCRRFLAWDLEASRGDVTGIIKEKFAQVLGREEENLEAS